MPSPNASLVFFFSLVVFWFMAAMAHSTEQMREPLYPITKKSGVTNAPQAEKAHDHKRQRIRQPVYKPPRREAPLVRLGGGTRGQGDTQPAVFVLVPEHTGFTTKTRPDLFWYSSGPTAATLEFALINDRSIDPILEAALEPTRDSGIYRISLSAFGIELSPSVEYQWSVAIVLDPEQRSRDLVATGRIEHVQLAPTLASELKSSSPEDLPYIYAREGLWYDALAALSNLIDNAPADSKLQEYRAALLEQVGLHDVAAAAME